jgi:NAD(P)-dependent dehydrogenase (short-subunit alcohol dehydrogenase family)
MRVFAGVRNPADGERLREESAGRLEPVLLDVTDDEAVRRVAADIDQRVGSAGLTGLVNNAGILVAGPWELLSSADVRRQMEVNVLGTHAVTQALLPSVRRASGRIVLIGSISGRVAPPYFGAYAASKHALEAMADTLRMELKPWRISVSLVQPDAVKTVIWSKSDREAALAVGQAPSEARDLYDANMRRMREANLRMSRTGMPVSAVVSAVRHALVARRPKPRYPVGSRTGLAIWAVSRLPTSVMDWFMMRAMGLREV